MRNKALILIIAFFAFQSNVKAQNYLEDAAGRPLRGNVKGELTGSPLLFSDFVVGSVELKSSKVYKEVPLNIDLLNQEVIFKGKDGKSLGFTEEVSSVIFPETTAAGTTNRLFKKGFPGTSNSTDKDYFEVLAEGPVSLLKRTWKTIWEEKTYNSATVTQSVLTKTTYYIYNPANKTIKVIKPGKSAVLDQLPNHKPEIETYIKSNKVNFSNDASLAKLFSYYNSL